MSLTDALLLWITVNTFLINIAVWYLVGDRVARSRSRRKR